MAKYTFEIGGTAYEVQAKSGEMIIEGEVIAYYYKEKSNYGLKFVDELGRCHAKFGSLENAARATLSHYLSRKQKA